VTLIPWSSTYALGPTGQRSCLVPLWEMEYVGNWIIFSRGSEVYRHASTGDMVFRVVSVRDPIVRISRTPSISRTLQIPPPAREVRTKNPVATHRGAHRPDALTTIKAPTTLMRPGPSRRPKVSPRSQHRFGFRSPPRLELATSSSRPLPPDTLSIWPALAFQVPIRSLSHGCSAVLCGWTSRSPAPRFVSLLCNHPSDPVPVIACTSKPPILFFPLGSML